MGSQQCLLQHQRFMTIEAARKEAVIQIDKMEIPGPDSSHERSLDSV
jgi:hypothetical protein